MTLRVRVPRSTGAIGVVSAISAVAGLLVFWALMSPPLATIDEPRHVNSVLRILQGGGWPPPYTATMTEGTLVAMEEAGNPLVAPSLAEIPGPDDRAVVTELTEAGLNGAEPRDWMNQHPPTYYGLIAGGLSVLGADDWRWDQQLMAMRLMSVSMVVGGVLFVAGSVRRMSGSAAAAVIGVLAIVSVPQFFNVLSLVTNDALAVLASSGFLYFLVRAWREQRVRPGRVFGWSAAAGALLGVGLLTKGTLLAAIPVVFATLLVVGWRLGGRWHMRLAPAAISMAVAFAVGGWWYLRNIIVYGEIQASNGGTGRNAAPAEGYDFREFASSAIAQLAESFWGSIRATLSFPPAVLVLLVILTVAALVVTLVWSKDRVFFATLLILPACIAGLILFHAWEVYWNGNYLAGVQGRYFFGGITIYSLLFAVAWTIAVRRASAIGRGVSSLALGAAFLLMGMWGARHAFVHRWASPEGVVRAWADAAQAGPFSATALTVTVAIVCLASASALLCLGALASRHKVPSDTGSHSGVVGSGA